MSASAASSSSSHDASGGGSSEKSSVILKVGMVGDSQIGKTSLMVRYVEGSFNEDYIQTLGVNFMEKTISIRNTEITFSIWDLGGQREFVNMLPLVCNDAVAILFMFDLTRKSTLNSIKEWYRQARGFNKTAIPFLVGTKYDHYATLPREEQDEITKQARRFSKAMKAPLIFCSTSHAINVQKIFKVLLAKAFDLKCTIPEIKGAGEPLLIYQSPYTLRTVNPDLIPAIATATGMTLNTSPLLGGTSVAPHSKSAGNPNSSTFTLTLAPKVNVFTLTSGNATLALKGPTVPS
ncbi:hypothetical protein [Sporisorium scitamineum]|uniref:Uncharacterized protein n=1 Tax=Sporisorium scitamineum TaxID=49012 RepID=A0A0F7S9V9_9BASI|nr:hypothetical protein [Sporisorium scitamineum]